MGKVNSFRDLKIWRKGIELVKAVYEATEQFPEDERYGLTSQMRRSAVSIPSNVAEGFRRGHSREFRQFLNVTLGSCSELETQIVISRDLRYLDSESESDLSERVDHLSRMVTNLKKQLSSNPTHDA